MKFILKIEENDEVYGRYILIHGTLLIHNGEFTAKHIQFLNILLEISLYQISSINIHLGIHENYRYSLSILIALILKYSYS